VRRTKIGKTGLLWSQMNSTGPRLETSTMAPPWVPLWQGIERIASAIGDSREPEHYAKTRLYIRQAALDGRLRIRGRHEVEVAGQDRTNFSDVYTEIPQAYWKHSVINPSATAFTYETDRHTNPETAFSWGPKGVYETNSYAGLQLNSDDVSQLIGDVSGIGVSAHSSMAEKDEWISAASALSLLGMKDWLLGTGTICKRAHAGLIQARAERFIHDDKSADDVDIPIEFWWAEGNAALTQNWTTGDFDTWVGRGIDRIQLQAFGVTFRRSDIERLRPAFTPASTPATGLDERQKVTTARQKIFIGHGHSLVWHELKDFLQDHFHLTIDEFNSVSTAGVAIPNRLEEMLHNAAFAFLILTAEDEQADGTLRARENVVHEAGLFQGRLGFKKAILLLEETCDKFSNAHGLGYISFPPGNIKAAFQQAREVLEREKVINAKAER
jgi:predicted nucleotide-binding protein